MAKNQQQHTNVKEQIFETVTTIVDDSIKDLGYNITKICEVIDDSEKERYKYKVKCGSLEMNVVDDNKKKDPYYENGNIVRVTIPNGNYNAKKVIEGLYSAGSEEDTIYVEPRNHFVPMTDPYVYEINKSYNLNTDNSNTSIIEITNNLPNINLDKLSYFDCIYVKFWLKYNSENNRKFITGDYTINMTLHTKDGNDKEQEETFAFSSTKIIGNPYDNLSMPQDVLFKPQKSLLNLSKIDFTFKNGNPFLENVDANIDQSIQIEVEKIEFQLGHEYSENLSGLKLFTFDSPEYGGVGKGTTKDLRYIWYNSDENKNFVGLNEFGPDEVEVPDNLDEWRLIQKMEKCIEEDVKKEYPQDEEGLKLQVIWKEAEKPIQELQKEFSKLEQSLAGLKEGFHSIYNYSGFGGSGVHSDETRQMLYWLTRLETSMEQIWWKSSWSSSMKWVEERSWFCSKEGKWDTDKTFIKSNSIFNTCNYKSSNPPQLFAPRIKRGDGGGEYFRYVDPDGDDGNWSDDNRFTLLKADSASVKIQQPFDFYLFNGNQVKLSGVNGLPYGIPNWRPDIIDAEGNTRKLYPGSITYGLQKVHDQYYGTEPPTDFAKNIWSEDAELILNVIGIERSLKDDLKTHDYKRLSAMGQLKAYLIQQQRKYNNDPSTEYTNISGAADYEKYDARWAMKDRIIRGRHEWNDIITYPRIMSKLITLHNKRVEKFNQWENLFNNFAEEKMDNNCFKQYNEALQCYYDWIEETLKYCQKIKNNSTTATLPTFDTSTVNNSGTISNMITSAKNATYPYNNGEDKNIKDLSLEIKTLAIELNTNLSQSYDDAFDESVQGFYDTYIQPINNISENIVEIVTNLDNQGYFGDFKTRINKYVEDVEDKIYKNSAWTRPEKQTGFFLCLLQNVPGSNNVITEEENWELCAKEILTEDEVKKIFLPSTDKNGVLQSLVLTNGKYYPVSSENINVNLENSVNQQSTGFKLVLIKDEEVIAISNIVEFKNIINLNLFSITPRIRLSESRKTGFGYIGALPLNYSPNSIIFDIQCYADELEKLPISCQSYSEATYPALEITTNDVFGQINGKRTEELIDFNFEFEANSKFIRGLQIKQKGWWTWEKNEIPTPLIFSIILHIDSTTTEQGFVAIPLANASYLYCSGPKILIFEDDGTIHLDSQNPYKLIRTGNEDKILETISVKIHYFDRKNLNLMNYDLELLEINQDFTLKILNNSYNSFYPYLYMIEIVATDEEDNEYIYFQPLLYFNQKRYAMGWGSTGISNAFSAIADDNMASSEINYSDFSFSTPILVNDEPQQSTFSTRRSKDIVATGSSNNIKSNVEMELHGKSFLSPDFPYFQFFSDRSGKLISIDPNQDPPIKLSYQKDTGIELYYNGTIKLIKKDLEPLIISYQDLIDGTLGVQIQQIGVIQDDEIISTCN